MKIKAEEISSIIKEKIEDYAFELKIQEVGRVLTYADGVARVYGLRNVMYYEMVEFESGDVGIASSLEEGFVGVVVLGSGKKIQEGMSVKRLNRLMKVPVGRCVIGRVLDALIPV